MRDLWFGDGEGEEGVANGVCENGRTRWYENEMRRFLNQFD